VNLATQLSGHPARSVTPLPGAVARSGTPVAVSPLTGAPCPLRAARRYRPGPPGSTDMTRQRLWQGPGMPAVRVDLMLCAARPQANGAVSPGAVRAGERGLYRLGPDAASLSLIWRPGAGSCRRARCAAAPMGPAAAGPP
jgi:hypothetical protein